MTKPNDNQRLADAIFGKDIYQMAQPAEQTKTGKPVLDAMIAASESFAEDLHKQVVKELQQQRDELLAAIKGLLYGPGDGFGHNSRAERNAALDAIAAAERKN